MPIVRNFLNIKRYSKLYIYIYGIYQTSFSRTIFQKATTPILPNHPTFPQPAPQRRSGKASAAGTGDFADDVDGGRVGALSLHDVLLGADSNGSKVSGMIEIQRFLRDTVDRGC